MSEKNIAVVDDAQCKVVEPVKPYTFRTLGGADIFPMFRLISKIGIKEFNACLDNKGIRNLFANMSKSKQTQADETAQDAQAQDAQAQDAQAQDETPVTYIAVLLEVADVLFANIGKCENDVFKLLSDTSDLTVAQVRELSLAQFAEMVVDFVKKEEFKDFFAAVMKLFK